MKILGQFKLDYEVVEKEFLGIKFYSLQSLDKTIDQLCELLGEKLMDDALKEDYCPYFGVPWESGLGLAQYLDRMDLKDRTVLEIGSGLSLPSFVLARNGANVIASDFHQDVEVFLKYNQLMNNIKFPYHRMNWRTQVNEFGKFDLVIGSDVLYESAHPEHVAFALLRYLNPGGKIILSDPGRAYVQKFVEAMNKLGKKEVLIIESVKTSWTQKDVFIFEF